MHSAIQPPSFILPVLVLLLPELICPIDYTNQTLQTGLRQGRWGMFFTYEPVCTIACRRNGKFSGRMYGGVCRCYCPRSEKLPCTGTYPSCDRLCRQNSYDFGGDCLDDTTCYCVCTVRQRQAPNGTEPSSTVPPCAAAETTPPSGGGGSANVPSPGSLGDTRTDVQSRKHTRRRKNSTHSTKINRTQHAEVGFTTEIPEIQHPKPSSD